MKSKFFVISAIIIVILTLCVLIFSNTASAQTTSTNSCPNNTCPPPTIGDPKYIRLQVEIPGVTSACTYKEKRSVNGSLQDVSRPCYYIESNLPLFIKKLYSFSIGIIAIIAVIMIMLGGLKWIYAAGNPSTISAAKSQIFSAVAGLTLALCSYVILNTINPELTNLKFTTPNPINVIAEKGQDCMLLPQYTKVKTDGQIEVIDPSRASKFDCGKEFTIINSVNEEAPNVCLGNYCGQNFGQCITKTYQGDKGCVQSVWAGNLGYTKDWWLTGTSLYIVCKNQGNMSATKIWSKKVTGDQGDRFYYSVWEGMTDIQSKTDGVCQDKGGLKGIALGIMIQRGGWNNDDSYAIGKGCSLISQLSPDKDYQPDKKDTGINWDRIGAEQLVGIDDIIIPQKTAGQKTKIGYSCDLYIDSSFQNR